MKKTKHFLVLQFTALQGLARAVMHEYAQNRLFVLGYSWDNGTNSKVQFSDTDAIFVCVRGGTGSLTFCTTQDDTVAGLQSADYTHELFSVSYGLLDFLDRAKNFRCVTTEIHGVAVQITSIDIKIDGSQLLGKVKLEAERLQAEYFGVK
mgnify:CR=1 FL=1